MKKVLLILLLVGMIGFAGCAKEAEARGRYRDPCDTPLASIMNTCQDVDPDHEEFDYGAYLHLILYESDAKDWEIGLFNTYEVERDEYTALIGAKIYLNRLFWQKPAE
jgi:hypothetical protein